MPTKAAAKTQAKTMPLSGIEFIVFLFFQTNPAVCWLENDAEAARVQNSYGPLKHPVYEFHYERVSGPICGEQKDYTEQMAAPPSAS